MSERSIFLNALDRENPAARAAYLDEACAGRPELRQRIERLLRAHQMEGAYLEVSAPEQLRRGDQALTFLAPPREPGALGRMDHYDVLEVVGRGATGTVFKARDGKLQRIVALKVLSPRLAASRPARERFVREAQATAAVRDDHVIAIHAVSDEGPLPYLVMEYISGVTLEDRIKKDGPLQLREILRIGLQVASGLAAAHAQGLIHRDIKPANILLENGVQRVKITDFGLALAAAAALAEHGVIAGTPSYMAPCQARGEATTERSDLFSLGAVLYALCTGRPPFDGNTTAEILQSVTEAAPRPIHASRPDLPQDLCHLIGKLLAKDPADRFGSAREVADLLTGRLAQEQQQLPPPGTAASAVPVAEKPGSARAERPSWRACLLVAGLLAALIGLGVVAAVLKPWQWGAPATHRGDTTVRKRRPAEPLNLRREDVPPRLLTLAGGGDPAHAPPELAAVLGDGKYLLPRIGQTAWMEQSPDGKLLAVPLDEDVILFDAATGEYLRSLKGPGGRVFRVTFSRDNQQLAATTRFEGSGGSVRVWTLADDRVLFTHPQPGLTIDCAAAFSGDGRDLFTESGGRIQVWESRTGASVQSVEISRQGVGPICVSPDGRRLAAAVYWSKCAKVFDWDGTKLTEVRTLEGHEGYVAGLAYSPDGKFLATGDEIGFKLWNADALESVRTLPTPAAQLAFSPDSQSLFASTTNGTPRPVHTFTRWNVSAGTELPAIAAEASVDPVRAFHYLSRDGKILFVAPQHGATYIRAVDAATGNELFPRQGHSAPVNAVAVSSDGRTAASAGEDWTVRLWDLGTGRLRRTLKAHSAAVCGLAFSPDGDRLASGSLDGTIILWNVDSGAELRRLKGLSHSFSRVCFSPDGRIVAAGGEGGFIKRWDADSGEEQSPLPGHAGPVRCVAFSPDGMRLASGGEDKTVRLHDLTGGSPRRFAMPSAVNDVAFSRDGRRLAAVGDAPDFTVRLWDLETGQETTWKGHTGPVRGLAFAPTEPILASCAEDGTIRMWDLTAGEPGPRIIDLGPFSLGIRDAAFTPDGRYLVTANGNGAVYVLRAGSPP